MVIKKKPSPHLGDRKIVRKFALFPIETDDCYYWMEFVDVEYVFRSCQYRENGRLTWENKWILDSVIVE